jgi:hypothetical protein
MRASFVVPLSAGDATTTSLYKLKRAWRRKASNVELLAHKRRQRPRTKEQGPRRAVESACKRSGPDQS